MTIEELVRNQPWFTQDPKLSGNPPVGMLGTGEARLYYFLVQQAFTGAGTIVDAGSFLGKSAYYLASGLKNSPNYVSGQHRVYCFDNFLVNDDGTIRFIHDYLSRNVAIGASTRAIFELQVARVRDMLVVHEGDFHHAAWESQPIEILMVDIAKTVSLGKRVVKVFFPDLIAGQSLVIHQDYHHPWLPHIHVVMEYLAEYFELVAPRVDDSAVFFYRKRIPEDALRRAAEYDFSYEEQLHLMDGAISRLPAEDRFYVRLARIVLQCGTADEASLQRELEDLESDFRKRNHGYSQNPYFDDVRRHVDELDGWAKIRAGNYERALELAARLVQTGSPKAGCILRGSALTGLGRYEEAEQELRAGLDTGPRPLHGYIALSRSLLHQGRFDEAEAELLEGIEGHLDPNGLSSYFDLFGAVLIERNEPEKEKTALTLLYKQFPESPELPALEARVLFARGQADAAELVLMSAASRGLDAQRLEEMRRPYVRIDRSTGSESRRNDARNAGVAAYPQASEGRKPWKSVPLPAAVSSICSMLSFEEQQYLCWLTAEKFENWGAIVELGCWLGAGSVALAEGLRRRNLDARVHSFDLFRWEPYMESASHAGLHPGDDFMSLFQQEIGAYAPWISPQRQDLTKYAWEQGPIEILVIDSARGWDFMNAILNSFGPHLVPGRSRVVVQDFRYPWAHCLPLIFDSRPDLWKEVESADDGDAVTFVPLKGLGEPGEIPASYSEEDFPLEIAERLFQSRLKNETTANHRRLLKTLYRKYLIEAPFDRATGIRESVVLNGTSPVELAEIEDVETIILTRGWKAYNESRYLAAKCIGERCLSIPRKRSIYALTLLGFSLLRLGEKAQAKVYMDEVLSLSPGFAPAKLFRSEVALQEEAYDQAESDAIEVLKGRQGDETTIQWALDLLTQAWKLNAGKAPMASRLDDLASALGDSPAFLASLAKEQHQAGHEAEAIQTVEKALALAPDHKLANQLYAEWTHPKHVQADGLITS